MRNRIDQHFDKILHADISACNDYDEKIISIVRVGKNPETLTIEGITALMKQVLSAVPFDEAKILVKRTTSDYGVLTIKSTFAPFLSYACMMEKEKITKVTLYIYQPATPFILTPTPLPKSQAASKMFWKHVRAMCSISADVITKDYAEKGVVITNMAKDVCEGKPQIYRFCDSLMKNSKTLLKKMDFHGISSVRWKICSAEEDLLLFTIEAPKMNMVMTETYVVKNGKIQFECSIADGAMLDLVHECLDETE